MIRHIVMIKLKSNANKEIVSATLKSMLKHLELSINSLLKMEVGINISTKSSAYDLVLIADFDDSAGLDEYRVHPEHIKVLDYLKVVMDNVTAVDYEC